MAQKENQRIALTKKLDKDEILGEKDQNEATPEIKI